MKKSLLIILLSLFASVSSYAIVIKDACLSVRKVNGTAVVGANVVYDASVSGFNVHIWWHDGTSWQTAGIQTSATTLPNGDVLYTYSLGSFPLPFLTPLCLYPTWTASPPISMAASNYCAYACLPDMKYACSYTEMVNGVLHNFVRVVYGPYIAGLDVNISIWDGTNFGTPIAPSDKDLVNGFWRYTYDLGAWQSGDPTCWDVYTAWQTPTDPNSDPHYKACPCGCDAKFTYCVNTWNPNQYYFHLENLDPSVTAVVKVDGTEIHNGPAVSDLFYTSTSAGVKNVCVKINGECEYCIPICFPTPVE